MKQLHITGRGLIDEFKTMKLVIITTIIHLKTCHVLRHCIFSDDHVYTVTVLSTGPVILDILYKILKIVGEVYY